MLSGLIAGCAVGWRKVLPHASIALPACACAVIAALAAGDLAGAAPVLGSIGAASAAALVGRAAPRDSREQLVSGLVLAGVALAATAWVGVALRHSPLALVNEGLWRGSSTLTYANATAGVLAPLSLVALARAAAEPDRLRWRLAAVVMIVGVGATLSRAGWAALALGTLVLAWRVGWQKLVPLALPVVLGAAVATAGVIAAAPERLPSRPLMTVATLAGGMAVSVVRFRRSRHSRHWLRIAAVPSVALVVVGGATLAHATGAVSAKRLTVSSPDRADEWNTTLAVVGRHSILGVGPTHLNLTWATSNGHLRYAKATHNEFLQLAAEQGLPALAVAAATLLLIGVALTKRSASDSEAWPAAGALAALTAFVVASTFDFTWHVALLPILAAAVVGSAFPISGPRRPRAVPVRGAQPPRCSSRSSR
jgi:hypothetical protein